jgi:hypothetical protein
MRLANTLAAGCIALGFGVVSFIMLRIEPQMGFVTPADYFDPENVVAGYATTAWKVENLIYLLLPFALLVLARSADDTRARVSGVIAAVLFFLLGALDRVGIQLPALAPDGEAVRAALMAMLPVRAAVLKTAVVALGALAWTTTRAPGGKGMWTGAWRGLGWVILAGSGLFVFVFVPAPLLFFVWGLGLTFRLVAEGHERGRVERLEGAR